MAFDWHGVLNMYIISFKFIPKLLIQERTDGRLIPRTELGSIWSLRYELGSVMKFQIWERQISISLW